MTDIQPGDLVVCVDARQLPSPLRHHNLKLRGIYRVSWVGSQCWNPLYRKAAGTLTVDGAEPSPDSNGTFCSLRFQKLNDGEDDAELIEQIKSCKPVREPSHA